MKAYLRSLLDGSQPQLEAEHIVREYLQARILQSLQRTGAMKTLAFHGGTSLRFLYDLPRYSEDLDFACERREQYDFNRYLRQVEKDLSAEGYAVSVKISDKRVVHKAYIRFRGLLYDLGLSDHQSEVIFVKVEVDTNPPAGAGLSTTPLQKHVSLNLFHHDPATLFAGKINAVLQRVYLKGRDIYDLWWYLSQPDWPEPNFVVLNNGLAQGGWEGEPVTTDNWRNILREKVVVLDWELVMDSVGSFLISKQPDFNKTRLLELLKD